MGDPVTAAIIAGAVALVGTGWRAWTWYKDREQARAAATAALNAANVVSNAVSYEVDALIIKVEIRNRNGDSLTERRIHGLRVRPGSTVTALHGDFSTSGKFDPTEPPTLVRSSRDDVSFDGTLIDEQHFQYQMSIHGGVSHDDSPFDFTYRICAIGGYLLDKLTIKAKWGGDPLPFEFFNEIINIPAKRLEVVITFPADSNVRPFGFVTVGESAQVARDERKTVENAFSFANGTAKLLLDSPKIGHRYMVCWDGSPPTTPKRAV
jgi:hypothetical protein